MSDTQFDPPTDDSPSYWESRYRNADTPWDRCQPAPALLEFNRRQPIRGRILVPGCGTAADAAWVASLGNCSVTAIDLSPTALATAADRHKGHALDLLQHDFLSSDPVPGGPFDWIIEHTCFCTIDPALRPHYVKAAAMNLRPGGHLLGIFFTNLDTPDSTGPPFNSDATALRALFSTLFRPVSAWCCSESFVGREHEEEVHLWQRRTIA